MGFRSPAQPPDHHDHGHTYGEAFMRMPYRCDDCGAMEWIWNSRDGVTPYLITCRSCGGTARHSDWRQDRYEPGYRPSPGERIFVDSTFEDCVHAAEAAFQKAKGTPYEVPEELHESWVRQMAADIPTGDPKLVVVEAGAGHA